MNNQTKSIFLLIGLLVIGILGSFGVAILLSMIEGLNIISISTLGFVITSIVIISLLKRGLDKLEI